MRADGIHWLAHVPPHSAHSCALELAGIPGADASPACSEFLYTGTRDMCLLTSETGLTVSMLVSYSAVLSSQNNLVKCCLILQ